MPPIRIPHHHFSQEAEKKDRESTDWPHDGAYIVEKVVAPKTFLPMALLFVAFNLCCVLKLEAVKNRTSKKERIMLRNNGKEGWQKDRRKYFIMIINKMISIVHSGKMTEKRG